jgi:hypothetical protein
VPYRRRILRTLKLFQHEYPNSWLAARDIRGLRSGNSVFAKEVDRLLEEKLILTISAETGGESEAAYRLNPAMLRQANKELFRHWTNWLMLATAILVGVAAFLIVRAN